mmetsp:Transcript_21227/g.81061  ORF Transcript_21227/g.81061 Transcript_21227/m.81061 type:complete len:215 (-) Transcript_21227:26-670(-)
MGRAVRGAVQTWMTAEYRIGRARSACSMTASSASEPTSRRSAHAWGAAAEAMASVARVSVRALRRPAHSCLGPGAWPCAWRQLSSGSSQFHQSRRASQQFRSARPSRRTLLQPSLQRMVSRGLRPTGRCCRRAGRHLSRGVRLACAALDPSRDRSPSTSPVPLREAPASTLARPQSPRRPGQTVQNTAGPASRRRAHAPPRRRCASHGRKLKRG